MHLLEWVIYLFKLFALFMSTSIVLILFFLSSRPKRIRAHEIYPYVWMRDILHSLLHGLNSFAALSLVIYLFIALKVFELYCQPLENEAESHEQFYFYLQFYLTAVLLRLFLLRHSVYKEAKRLNISTREDQSYWFNMSLLFPALGMLFIWWGGNATPVLAWLYFALTAILAYQFTVFFRCNRDAMHTHDHSIHLND